MTRVRDLVIMSGSFAAAHTHVAAAFPDQNTDELVEEEWWKLVAEAPRPLRGSQSAVISYHRWNDIYMAAYKAQPMDAKSMSLAQKEIDSLLKSVH